MNWRACKMETLVIFIATLALIGIVYVIYDISTHDKNLIIKQ